MLDECDKAFFSTKTPTILFLDEIHRFSKNQQDVFLPYVESGKLVLIGATSENPSFTIIPVRFTSILVEIGASLAMPRFSTAASIERRVAPRFRARFSHRFDSSRSSSRFRSTH